MLTEQQKQHYREEGFVLLHGVAPLDALAQLEARVTGYAAELRGGGENATLSSVAFAQALLAERGLERHLYDGIRTFPWLQEVGCLPQITEPVSELFGEPVGLMEKIPMRLDLPHIVRELAVWHQDYHYVGGNEEIITAWIPLADTPYVRGCLMVMPGSHKLGILEHDNEVLGKRHFPSGIFDREVRYVEMQRGDLLLFHALLLHSSGINLSEAARLSVQARYTALSRPTDPSMGKVIPISEGQA